MGIPEESKINMVESAKKHGVASLELSKQLREIGYPQKGIFKWANFGTDYSEVTLNWYDLMMIDCIAPTVAELGEVLPPCYPSQRRHPGSDGKSEWESADNTDIVHFFADTEADAKAKMAIWAIKKKKIEFK